ncbi:MAG: zinc ribbon domain-containing protein [Chloroflexota bacterium]|nr:MAG: zinc ribbon domain-containing protein [Chloroflexota bacterium]
MDIGSLLLLLSLLILIGLYIARPLFDQDNVGVTPEEDRKEHELSTLLAERDRVLTALEELDFDNTLGKIPGEDYAIQRARLVNQGADVLRKLDELNGGASEAELEQRIEEAIAERRVSTSREEVSEVVPQPQPVVVDADDEVEVQLAARRRARQDRSAGFCPQCGRPVQQSDQFCPKCGNALA